jgi:Beta-galactosidase
MKILTLFAVLFGAVRVMAAGSYHIQIYDLPDQGVQPDPRIYTLPFVDGVSGRVLWKDVEPSPGVFDWSYFDTLVANASAAGKWVELRVMVQGGQMPQWVKTNSQLFTPSPVDDGSSPIWV